MSIILITFSHESHRHLPNPGNKKYYIFKLSRIRGHQGICDTKQCDQILQAFAPWVQSFVIWRVLLVLVFGKKINLLWAHF